MMRAAKLLIIDPSTHTAEVEGTREVLGDWPGASQVLRPALRPEDRLSGLGYQDLDGVVIMGSAASVHDDVAWLEGLKRWLTPIVSGEVGVALLGLCFGHQLIAERLGGEVGFLRDDRSKRRGVEVSA